ncbi:C2H2 finger domain protein [Penicillium waksmanii]|uniref:C2H2 finger domain protein n=1 Tax=Penicillium waksmanii TaxID=69791 RepID=UPI0025499C0D|nr:C2H2 finger domain protein [Penicillium waksmanii]KAJ5975176.1 C2H2 finger domain protein [Penicillium waksmanii]
MPPRGFTNPAPKTESARSALSSFTCTLCSKSYSRHPEYEAHIGSYDHQHRKRLQDLKQLSRDPNAAEKARRAERKADAEAGLRVIDTPTPTTTTGGGAGGGGGAEAVSFAQKAKAKSGAGGGGFKKGGFKSSFASVKGSSATGSGSGTGSGPVKRNVLGDDGDDDGNMNTEAGIDGQTGKEAVKAAPTATATTTGSKLVRDDVESDTDEEYARDLDGGGYYDPRRPTGCFGDCGGVGVSGKEVKALS